MIRVALAFLLICGAAHGQAVDSVSGIGGIQSILSSSTYTGPVDVVASPTSCWSLRACSAVKRGSAAINVCNVGDAACADVVTDASTGNLPATITIGGSDCSAVACTVKTWYDQTGSGCSGPCNFAQASAPSRPHLKANCINTSYWCLDDSTNDRILQVSGTFPTIAQQFTYSVVMQRTGNFTTQGYLLSGGTANGLGFNNAVNQGFMYAGAAPTFTAADSVWLSVQAVFNGASSIADVNGTATTGLNAGATSAANPMFIGVFLNGVSAKYTGYYTEILIYPVGFNATQYAAMTSNQRAFWGF